jgi:hypothetical protein
MHKEQVIGAQPTGEEAQLLQDAVAQGQHALFFDVVVHRLHDGVAQLVLECIPERDDVVDTKTQIANAAVIVAAYPDEEGVASGHWTEHLLLRSGHRAFRLGVSDALCLIAAGVSPLHTRRRTLVERRRLDRRYLAHHQGASVARGPRRRRRGRRRRRRP